MEMDIRKTFHTNNNIKGFSMTNKRLKTLLINALDLIADEGNYSKEDMKDIIMPIELGMTGEEIDSIEWYYE